MQLENVKRNIVSSGTLEVAKATIRATPKIFDMFANDTYANKPEAITRELVANGIDAHIAAGTPERPVEVTMPTALDPVFKVRDFGTGMPHDFVMGPFMAYTDGSTKDKSDDQIGGFGIGSKSPFAYTDQFTLRVVHEGILSVYTMFKDEDGIPAIGLQGQTTTDEHNGVEVSFPVDDDDQQTFRDAAQIALQYFQPLPIVHNGTLNPPDYNYVGKGWALRPSAGSLGVIMGGVRYPVAENSLDYDLRYDRRLAPLLGYGIDLTMPIGAAAVAMSREALSYTTKTSANIKKALEAVIDDVIATFATLFDTAPTKWEAMKLLWKEIGGSSYYNTSPRQALMAANAKYKGQPLATSLKFDAKDYPNYIGSVWHLSDRRKLKTAKWETIQEMKVIEPGRVQRLIIDDLPQNSASKTILRIAAYFDDKARSSYDYVFRPVGQSATEITALLDLLGNPQDVIYTSSMPEPPKASRTKIDRPRVRMWTFNGQRDEWTRNRIVNLTPARSKRNAITEIAYVNQPATGIMVVMSNFDLPKDFYKKMDTQLVKYNELVFVNEGDAEKIKTQFKKFEDVFTERFQQALAKYPELPQRLALTRDKLLVDLFDFIRQSQGLLKPLTPAQQARPFGRILALYNQYIGKLDAEQNLLAPLVESVYPKGVDTAKLLAAFQTKQADAYLLLSLIRPNKAAHIDLFQRNL